MTVNKFLAYTGHINLDVVLKVDKINDNVTLPVSEVKESFGGTAGNFAVVASKLGMKFRLYSIVSKVSHGNYIKKLNELNIDLSGVKITDESYGPVCYAVNDGEKQKYFLAEGPMKYEKYNILDEKYEHLHLGTGNPELNVQMIENAMFDSLSFDPSQEVFFKYGKKELGYFLEKCEFIMGNEEEIKFMFKTSEFDLKDYAGKKHTVIMTAGSKGAYVYGDRNTHVYPFDEVVEGGNTLGAGDSFRAGFYYGLKNGLSIVDAVKCGNATSYEIVKNGIENADLVGERILSIAKKLSAEEIALDDSLHF